MNSITIVSLITLAIFLAIYFTKHKEPQENRKILSDNPDDYVDDFVLMEMQEDENDW